MRILRNPYVWAKIRGVNSVFGEKLHDFEILPSHRTPSTYGPVYTYHQRYCPVILFSGDFSWAIAIMADMKNSGWNRMATSHHSFMCHWNWGYSAMTVQNWEIREQKITVQLYIIGTWLGYHDSLNWGLFDVQSWRMLVTIRNYQLSGSVVYSRWINHSAICETQICSINSLVKFVYTSIMPYGKRSIVRFLFQLVIESSSVTLLLFWDTVYRCSVFGTIFWFWRGNLSLWVVCPGTCMTSITVSMITVSDIDI